MNQSQDDLILISQEEKTRVKKSVWLISFTDVISLMLAFFVLLFSMKETKEEYWSKVYSSLPGEISTFYNNSRFSGPDMQTGIERVEENKAFSLNYLEALFKQLLEKDPLLSKTEYKRLNKFLILSIDLESLVQQKSETGDISLGMLVNTLGRVDNNIEMLTYIQEKDGWRDAMDLSQSVARILENSGYNRDILISVYGSEEALGAETLKPGTVNLLISE